MSPFTSSNLPPDFGRVILHASVYMILQPIMCTATIVTNNTGELLPHLFTLTPTPQPPSPKLERGKGKVFMKRLFSVTLICSHEQLPVRKYGTLRCPDFPPRHKRSDRPICYFIAKISIKI